MIKFIEKPPSYAYIFYLMILSEVIMFTIPLLMYNRHLSKPNSGVSITVARICLILWLVTPIYAKQYEGFEKYFYLSIL